MVWDWKKRTLLSSGGAWGGSVEVKDFLLLLRKTWHLHHANARPVGHFSMMLSALQKELNQTLVSLEVEKPLKTV